MDRIVAIQIHQRIYEHVAVGNVQAESYDPVPVACEVYILTKYQADLQWHHTREHKGVVTWIVQHTEVDAFMEALDAAVVVVGMGRQVEDDAPWCSRYLNAIDGLSESFTQLNKEFLSMYPKIIRASRR